MSWRRTTRIPSTNATVLILWCYRNICFTVSVCSCSCLQLNGCPSLLMLLLLHTMLIDSWIGQWSQGLVCTTQHPSWMPVSLTAPRGKDGSSCHSTSYYFSTTFMEWYPCLWQHSEIQSSIKDRWTLLVQLGISTISGCLYSDFSSSFLPKLFVPLPNPDLWICSESFWQ